MIYLIAIYFIINAFVAGFFIGNRLDFVDDRAELITLFQFTIFYLFFGTLSMIWIILLLITEPFRKYMDETFQIQFWFLYVFTKRFDNVSQEYLKKVNERAKVKNRIFKYCTKLLNKRNNYTYTE